MLINFIVCPLIFLLKLLQLVVNLTLVPLQIKREDFLPL
jgi:hypothetical protein